MKTLRTASLSGTNSNEFYSLHFPESILRFCGFDFSNFIRKCTDFYKRCAEDGEYYYDEAVALKNSISACHKYFEVNIHGVFDKIVPDFMIETICREKGVGTSALWNSLISPRNSFEREIFKRLTEYRHNKATNQWVNLLKIQEYAIKKLDFVFSEDAELSVALAKRDYFDLTFSIAANEMGYSENTFTAAKLYSVGRLPSAPFIIGKVAKEIESTTLSQVDFPDELVTEKPSSIRSDTDAMDVFSAIKNYIQSRTDSVFNTVINTMRSMPKKVYIAESFKAVIDLEIDLILESKAVLRRCKRCGAYFLRDEEYPYDYCSNPSNGGKTCLEIEEENSVPRQSPEEVQELEKRVSELYSYMSKRINVDLTQREFAEWYQHFMAIKGNIADHKVSLEEFSDFEKYSKELKFDKNEAPQDNGADEQGDEPAKVKPFVFERVDRSEVYEQESRMRRKREREALSEEEEEAEVTPSIEDIAQEPKPTVKVMKASDAPADEEITLFENPFDGAFDEQIDSVEKDVRSRDFKPLDDIFNFGGDDLSTENSDTSEPEPVAAPVVEKPAAPQIGMPKAAEPAAEKPAAPQIGMPKAAEPVVEKPAAPQIGMPKAAEPAAEKPAAPQIGLPKAAEPAAEAPTAEEESKPAGGVSAIEALRKRYASAAKAPEAADGNAAETKSAEAKATAPEEGGFDKAFSKASYMRENSPATKSGFVAGRYMKTVSETSVAGSNDDVDILPESAAAVKTVNEAPVIKLDIPGADVLPSEAEVSSVHENSAIARLKAAAAASAKSEEQAKAPVSDGIIQRMKTQSASRAARKAEPGRSKDDMHDPKYTTNKTRRVLDGIMNPVKNKNPFIDE